MKIHWRRDRLPTPVFLCFPCGSAGKESACNAGDLGSILGLGRSPGEGKGYRLQYSGLENSLNYTVYGVAKSRTQLSKFHHHSLLTMPKPLTVWITTNCGKSLKRWQYQTTWPACLEICIQVKKQQLELDTEQQTGSNWERSISRLYIVTLLI